MRTRGFTLVELMISAALSGIILAGVLTTFVQMGRTAANVQNYTEIEMNARRGLEYFSREARSAYAVTYASTTRVDMSIPDTSSSRTGSNAALGAYTVRYDFDAAAGTFSRTGPPIENPLGVSSTKTIISGVEQISGINAFNYYRYVTGGGYSSGFTSNTAANLTEVKQIEISFLLKRKATTTVATTNKVISARFILRNK